MKHPILTLAATIALGLPVPAAFAGEPVALVPKPATGPALRHVFLAVDESRKQIHYVDQNDPTRDWSVATVHEGKPLCIRDIALAGAQRLVMAARDGQGIFVLDLQSRQYTLSTSITLCLAMTMVCAAAEKGAPAPTNSVTDEVARQIKEQKAEGKDLFPTRGESLSFADRLTQDWADQYQSIRWRLLHPAWELGEKIRSQTFREAALIHPKDRDPVDVVLRQTEALAASLPPAAVAPFTKELASLASEIRAAAPDSSPYVDMSIPKGIIRSVPGAGGGRATAVTAPAASTNARFPIDFWSLRLGTLTASRPSGNTARPSSELPRIDLHPHLVRPAMNAVGTGIGDEQGLGAAVVGHPIG